MEGIGDLKGSSFKNPGVEDQEAGLDMAMAPRSGSLINDGDSTILNVTFDRHTANFADVGQLTLILHAEAAQCTLLRHNCWRLARVVFGMLVEQYLQNGQRKMKFCRLAIWKTWHTLRLIIILHGVVGLREVHFF